MIKLLTLVFLIGWRRLPPTRSTSTRRWKKRLSTIRTGRLRD